MNNFLLTGGSGFIGRHFHSRLPNDQLVNLDLNEPSFKHSAEFIQGDIRRKEDIIRAVRGRQIRTIISLAAKHHDFGIGHDEYFDTNEEGTRILCEVASEENIHEIVFFSSVAVYGLRNEVSREDLLPSPDSPYGASKLAGEKVLSEWARKDPSRKVLIIRPTLVFGSHNMANMFNLIRQIDSGFYFHLGKADNIKSVAYVENIVSATMFLTERIRAGIAIYNYADEPQLTTRQISESIAHHLNAKISISLPKNLALVLATPFDIAIKLTGKNLSISSARIKKLATSTHHSARKLFAEGFKPVYSTYEGLEKMVNWYKALKRQR